MNGSARLALALLLFFLGAANSHAAPPSLAGRWHVVHFDAILGKVEGTARVAANEQTAEIVLVQPISHQSYTLRAKSIVRSGDKVTMVLTGRWPGAEDYRVPPLGQPVPIAAATSVRARLGDASVEAKVRQPVEPDESQVTLDMEFGPASALNGLWHYRANADGGRDRVNGGRIDRFDLAHDDSGTAVEEGAENWSRPEPQIFAVVPIVDQREAPNGRPTWRYPFGADTTATHGAVDNQRVLLVVGKDLPGDWGDPQSFVSLDSHISYRPLALPPDFAGGLQKEDQRKLGLEKLRRMLPPDQFAEAQKQEMILIDARMGEGVRPGRTGFTLNGAEGAWILEFGDYTASLTFVRDLERGAVEPTEYGFRPQHVRLEVMADRALPYDAIPLVIGKDGEVQRVGPTRVMLAKRVPGNPRVYRTDPIALIDARSPGATGGLQLAVERGDVVTAEIGEIGIVSLRPKQARLAILNTPAEIPAAVLNDPTARALTWKEALSTAAKCAGQPVYDWDAVSLQQAASVSNVVLFDYGTQGVGTPTDEIWAKLREVATGEPQNASRLNVRTTHILLGHHAAMLMLRQTFVETLRAEIAAYRLIRSDEGLLKGFRASFAPYAYLDEVPMGQIRVTDPKGAKVRFYATFVPSYLHDAYGLTGDAADRWVHDATLEAINQYIANIEHAIETAERVDDCDAKALLDLTGYGFEAVQRTLRARLLKLTQNGTPPRLDWTPDPVARSWLAGLSALADAVRAQKDLSKADSQLFLVAVSAAGAPALLAESIVLSGVAIAADVSDFGYVAFNEGSSQWASAREMKFARGAAAAIGLGRLREAEAKDVPWFVSLATVAAAGLGTGVNLYTNINVISKLRAIGRGETLLQTATAQEIPRLPAAQRAEAVAAIEEVRQLEQRIGRRALDVAEQRVATLADELDQTFALGSSRKPQWAARLSDGAFARIDDLKLRADVAKLVAENPGAMEGLIANEDALNILRGAPFENVAQLEKEVADAAKRLKTPLGEPFFRANGPRESVPREIKLGNAEGVAVRDIYGERIYEMEIFAGGQRPVGSFTRKLVPAPRRFPDRKMLVMEAAALYRNDPSRYAEQFPDWVTTSIPMIPEKGGTPINMYMNLRSMQELGLVYADANLAVVKMSNVLNANTAVQLHWMERVYGAANLNRYARQTFSVQYAESALTQGGWRITRVEVSTAGLVSEEAGHVVAGSFYDGRIPGADFLRRYNVAADETIKKGHDILIYVEPIH